MTENQKYNRKYIGRVIKIIDNLVDHIGYIGEDVTVISVEDNDYLVVENDKGNRWFAGIEETNIKD